MQIRPVAISNFAMLLGKVGKVPRICYSSAPESPIYHDQPPDIAKYSNEAYRYVELKFGISDTHGRRIKKRILNAGSQKWIFRLWL